MKRRVWGRILSIGVVCLVMWCVLFCSVKASEADYVITPIAADNNYYDLTVEPTRKQIIEAEIRNNTDNDVTVYAGFYTAVAGQDGAIEYIGPRDQLENNVKTLSEHITGNREIVIPANKSYLFQFTIDMPAGGMDVPIVGGIAFLMDSDQSQAAETGGEQRKEAELLGLDSDISGQAEIIRKGLGDWLQEKETASSGAAAFSYIVPLFLRTSGSSLPPNLMLKDILVEDYENKINVIIQNGNGISADKVNLDAVIRRKGKKEVFFEVREENAEIPANFDYELSVPSSGKKIKAGEYTLQMELTIGGTKWQWEKDFVIGKENSVNKDTEDAAAIGSEEVKGAPGRLHFIIIPVFGLMTAAVIAGILLYRKKQREDEAVIATIKEIIKQI